MSDVGSTSTLSRLRNKSSRKRCDLAMCHIGLLMVAITGIDVKSIAIAREEAILEEQGVRKRRAVSFTKHKAEPVLTGYRAGNMWKSSSISSDETGAGTDGFFNFSPLSEKHRTQSLGRRPWSKSASQPDVDGVYYKRIDSDSSVFTESETTRSTAPLLSNAKEGSRTKYDRATRATKHALKSKSSDSLPRNMNHQETRTKSPADSRGSDQRYSMPDIESQLPAAKLPPPPSSNSNRDLSRSPKTGLLLELNGGKSIRPRPRAQKNSSSTDESMTPTGLTPESETAKGFDNLGKDEPRPRTGRTASSTITDL